MCNCEIHCRFVMRDANLNTWHTSNGHIVLILNHRARKVIHGAGSAMQKEVIENPGIQKCILILKEILV